MTLTQWTNIQGWGIVIRDSQRYFYNRKTETPRLKLTSELVKGELEKRMKSIKERHPLGLDTSKLIASVTFTVIS